MCTLDKLPNLGFVILTRERRNADLVGLLGSNEIIALKGPSIGPGTELDLNNCEVPSPGGKDPLPNQASSMP